MALAAVVLVVEAVVEVVEVGVVVGLAGVAVAVVASEADFVSGAVVSAGGARSLQVCSFKNYKILSAYARFISVPTKVHFVP